MISQGKLVLVVGASAAGKDTLIRLASDQLGAGPFVFVPREITRPCDGEREHVPVSREQFEARALSGEYLLTWAAHGVWYGIPGAARRALRRGEIVVSIASRGVLDDARALPWECHVIEVQAPLPVLRARLLARGRQDGSDVEQRLRRASRFVVSGEHVHQVDNGGDLRVSGRAFCALLRDIAFSPVQLSLPLLEASA